MTTRSGEPEVPRDDVDKVLADFEAKGETLAAFCAKTKSLVEAILQDANVRYQSVQTRVKSKTKLRDKFLDPAKAYQQLDDITDLVGLRIITYYEDDVDRAAQIIKQEFDLDVNNSVDKRDGEPDRFGYSAINYVCKHLAKRTSDVEYKKFAGIQCEIQITSILRHAWSEIEHEWYDLRKAYPKNVKRRFYRIAALLELAESEFLDIKKKRTDYERSVAVRVEAMVPQLPLDPLSLRSFIHQDPVVIEVDKSIAELLDLELIGTELSGDPLELRWKAAKLVGFAEVEDVRESIKKHQRAIVEYVRACREFWIIGRNTVLGRGVCIPILAIMLACLEGNNRAVETMSAVSVGIGFNINVSSQIAIAQDIVMRYSK
jgi:putative GTP pyrophosphokinase